MFQVDGMDRRRFLAGTMLAGFGIGKASRSGAFTIVGCDAQARSAACQEVVRHVDLIARLDAELRARGVADGERQAVLAAAQCPFCGEQLLSLDTAGSDG